MSDKDAKITPAMLEALATGRGMFAGTPNAIEASERQGQADLVKGSDRLPLELRPDREAWEKLGFKFGEEIDELFMQAELPEGWKIVATNHAMHSDILDGDGKVRGGVFYKAAFYDQRADAFLSSEDESAS